MLLPMLSVGDFRSFHEFLRGVRLVDLLLRILEACSAATLRSSRL
jgi:hypothetical protein